MPDERFGILMEIYDANATEDPDVVAMSSGVSDERIVDDLDIETRYCEIKGVIPTANYLRIIGDDDFTDVEIRVLHKTLVALGWTPPPAAPTRTHLSYCTLPVDHEGKCGSALYGASE